MFGIINGKELSSALLFYLILTSELINRVSGCGFWGRPDPNNTNR
jgi:hypothetical protein